MAKKGPVKNSLSLKDEEHRKTYVKAAKKLQKAFNSENGGNGTTKSKRAQARAYAKAGVGAVNKRHGTHFTAAGGGQG